MFWKTLGKWAVVAVAVPLAAAGFRKLSQRMETRAGSSSRLSRTLGRTASGLDIVSGRRGRAATP